MTRFLPDGQTIRKEVKRIFSQERGRRVALVAFLGRSAEAYLPRPAGLELVCWPQAPGTNPATVEFLLSRKVKVRFAKRLHMKVYWTATRGAVVASTNLSTNAYGTGALHEAGVLVRSSLINIDSLLKSVEPQVVTKDALITLKRAAVQAANKTRGFSEKRTFIDWLEMSKRPPWLLCCIDSYTASPSQRLRAVAREETGSPKVLDWINCRKGELKPEDFVLTVHLGSSNRPGSIDWLYVHKVVLAAKRDRRYNEDYPFEAGQLYKNSACPTQPFHVDSTFRRALRTIHRELGDKADKFFSVDITRRPENSLLMRLKKHYLAGSSEKGR